MMDKTLRTLTFIKTVLSWQGRRVYEETRWRTQTQ